MFASKLGELGMFAPSPDSGILNAFPLSVKRKLILEITQCLLPRSSPLGDPGAILTSATHVNWMMEVIGQGFSLPIEDVIVIQDAINVYHSWLLEKSTRPAIIQQCGDSSDLAQGFFQTIFKHYSLMFVPRVGNSVQSINLQQSISTNSKISDLEECADNTAAHIELCRKVLSILLAASKTLANTFTTETWVVLVKVLLGISDIILTQPISTRTPIGVLSTPSTPGNLKSSKSVATPLLDDIEPYCSRPVMADKICEPMIKTLLEIWLRSGILSVEMWDRLKKHFVTWTHRIEVIHHWSAVIYGLTQNVVKYIFDESKLQSTVTIALHNGGNISIDFTSDFLVYSWHRTIYMIGNPCALSCRNFVVAITGLSKSISLLYSIDAGSNGMVDGNTILNMFGEWLFQAAMMHEVGFEEGRAEALGTLCRIFSKYQKTTKFLAVYLEHFYNALHLGLQADILSLTKIIVNSSELFVMELEGIRSLIPTFVLSLYRVLPLVDESRPLQTPPSSVAPETLRRSAYKLIGSIMALLNRFGSVNLHLAQTSTITSSTPYFTSAISSMVWTAYQCTPDNPACVIPQTDACNPGSATFSSLQPHVLNLLVNSVAVEMNPNNVRYVIHLTACYIVENADFCPSAVKIVLRVIQDKLLMSDHWTSVVVMSVIDCLNQFAALWEHVFRDEKETEVCISRAYDTLARWAILGDWLVNDYETQRVILSTLARGVALLDRTMEFSQVTSTNVATASTIISASSLAVSNPALVSLHGPSREVLAGSHPAVQAACDKPVSLQGGLNISTSQTFFNTSIPSGGTTFGKKTAIAIRASSSHTNKLFKLQRLSQNAGGAGGVSTGSKDGGIGLPTFATVSAEIRLKNAAESAIDTLLGLLGNFPPKSSCMGITKLGSTWDEIKEVQRLSQKQKLQNHAHDSEDTTLIDKRYIRYYSYENRLIFGFIERPVWAFAKTDQTASKELYPTVSTGNLIDIDENPPQTQRSDYDEALAIAMVIRDSSGKFSWWSKSKYEDNSSNNPEYNTNESVEQNTLTSFLGNGSMSPIDCIQTSSATTTSMQVSLVDAEIVYAKRLSLDNTNCCTSLPIRPYKKSLPQLYPYQPQNSSTVQVQVFTEDSIPHLNELCTTTSDTSKQEEIRICIEAQKNAELEQRTQLLESLDFTKTTDVQPPTIVDRRNSANIPQAFRIFLAEFGMLDLGHQAKIAPLQLSDMLIRDLEKLDRQPERDSISISVMYCQAGNVSLETILYPDHLPESFDEFLWSLGWPVDIKSHTGFKGNLTANICETAPYYANGNVEAVFHCPYLVRTSGNTGTTLFRRKPTHTETDTKPCSVAPLGLHRGSIQGQSTVSLTHSVSSSRSFQKLPSINSMIHESPATTAPPLLSNMGVHTHHRARLHTIGSADNIFGKGSLTHFSEPADVDDPIGTQVYEEFQPPPIVRSRTRSHTVGMAPLSAEEQFIALCQQISQTDSVYIIWVEDNDSIPALISTLAHTAVVIIFVNPLPLTNGLFWIHISLSGGTHEDMLKFGPLSDGMVVSRHALGMLCRHTAFSAYRYCRYNKNVYKRPTLLRRQLIEEICNRNKAQTGGFFADLFTQ
ncbi:hypothetical protein BATDEDRAFT_92176 [Batrachochytrium dendrobatidis JAM81]|uniref:Rap-GAP domain-containing protein n=1 Tax=Batrachochytrium dendrobatidis (strain JAM81 / FGSC 10211) TaxID=684364 RepID=F4PD15_BATDJ|nr:uncharacterized protein BATDEDRAFT_92176 [Batrachochytrium dendrobatidis JAM81]EGF76898.1 hypothetical protein BATDEDRAFT_92176 [Batrachochytrium dendrobatidis JAM81]|eukprot:XP_006682494.1 hypothetical protein BATDEDRAFT_92176 [Batrachochytrium dendrobatidis JAM81]